MLVTNRIPLSSPNYMLTSSTLRDATGIYNVHVGCHEIIFRESNTTPYVMTKVAAFWISEAPGRVQKWAALEALIPFPHECISENGLICFKFEQLNSSVFQIWLVSQGNFIRPLGKQYFTTYKNLLISGCPGVNVIKVLHLYFTRVAIRDFKIVHDGRLGRLDECHVTQNPRDI